MRRLFLAAIAALGFAGAAQATIYTGPVSADQIVTYGGYEWVWMSPCHYSFECPIDATEQSSQYGWRLPTAFEATTYIASNVAAFVNAFQTPLGAQYYAPGVNYACASGWFSTVYTQCQVADALGGYISNIGNQNFGAETFMIRDFQLPAVPVPASLPLIGGALAALGLMRRRKRS